MSWRLLDLGAVDGFTMTSLYEAVARAVDGGNSPNTLILNHPAQPFVNVGYHQVVEEEVDVDFVQQHKIPIVRRSIGGGTILDGPWEQDYFFIVRSPELSANIGDFYKRFLSPVVHALRRMGVYADYRPINDIVVKDRKISGNGGVSIGEAMVLAGDVLLDLPTELMTKVLRVPDEKFRDKLKKSLSEWMTSLKLELGEIPARDEVKRRLVEEFEGQVGVAVEEGEISAEERRNLDELLVERRRREWIFMKDISRERLLQAARTRQVKVKEGVCIYEGVYKAQKLIRITMETVKDRIADISISGDFFTEPHTGVMERLEQSLIGASLDDQALRERILTCFDSLGLRVTGATADDFIQAILVTKRTNLA
ncbi:lipoate--protein ligase family protein [Candidatus Bathyarchaeota archaeon]|nr:lipoate--protein ligase family protein [Candidatus Bathyarchaeota archaeon]